MDNNLKTFQSIWKSFKKNKAAMAGLIIITVFILLAVFADVIADYDLAIAQNKNERLLFPCSKHIF